MYGPRRPCLARPWATEDQLTTSLQNSCCKPPCKMQTAMAFRHTTRLPDSRRSNADDEAGQSCHEIAFSPTFRWRSPARLTDCLVPTVSILPETGPSRGTIVPDRTGQFRISGREAL